MRTGDPFAGGFVLFGGGGGFRVVFAGGSVVRDVEAGDPGADVGAVEPAGGSLAEAVVAVPVTREVVGPGRPALPQPATSRASASPIGPGIRRMGAPSSS
ncbi:hypothetical protein [Amycolatopsis sp.]|uniref:hypothetical protein n=1 Tax=Amycolatopsis sp. TaxID=37632 RepID=UPI002D7F5DB0|nr:hypothetical protein [Amycolatopsis sp.]HET6708278.1 hypothetical protein [Amycolatopsis sp.]